MMRRRIVVVPVIRDSQNRILLCRMPKDRGVFPGQWALPGGGVEDGERIEDALRREIREELSIEVDEVRPAVFKDDVLEKRYADGRTEQQHMVFLIFECRVRDVTPVLNDEFDAYAWVGANEMAAYDLNVMTRTTLEQVRASSDR